MKTKSRMIKLLCLTICLSLFTTMPALANVPTESVIINGMQLSFEELAVKAGMSEKDVKAFYFTNPTQFMIDAENMIMRQNKLRSIRTSPGNNATSFNDLCSDGWKGNILISATNSKDLTDFIDYRHGHAAIMYSSSYIVQAAGPGILSDYVPTSKFGATEKVRLYKVEPIETALQEEAANYAKNNLQDKEYATAPTPGDTVYLNCATLVWQAYDHVNFTLDTHAIGTVTPKTLVEDTSLVAKANLNWTGNGNSFDI